MKILFQWILIPLLFQLNTPVLGEDFPSNLQMIIKTGCRIDQRTQPLNNTLFYTTVWAEWANSTQKWDHLYSIRPKLKNSMEDCSEWLERIKKAVEKQRRR